MNRQNIFRFILSIANFLLKLCCIFNLPYFAALIIKLSLRKSTFISTKKLTSKTIIILEKSFGSDDLIEAYKKKSNIKFIILQRKFISTIYKHFLGNFSRNEIRETSYITKNSNIENRKIKYRLYLISILHYLKKFINFQGFLSFNLFYISERELQLACKELNIKFIVCHKESVCAKKLNSLRINMWRNSIGKCHATAVSVYNNYTKKSMILSKLIKKNKITVTGMPRADFFFQKPKYKKFKHKDYILFLMIEHYAQLPNPRNYSYPLNLKKNIKFFSWKKNAILTTKIILEYAKTRPDLKFVFKTKPNTSIDEIEIFRKYDLKNCQLINGGSSIELIKNSKYIIAFNTTGIFEGMIVNKKIIIPNFQNSKLEQSYMFKINGKNVIYPKTKRQMLFYLNKLSEIKNTKNNIKTKNRYIKYIKKHLCNTDGKSGQRLRNFINNNI